MHEDSHNQMLFGVHPLLEAIDSGRTISKVLLRRGIDSTAAQKIVPLLKMRDIPFQYVPVEKLNRITRKNHQGIVALVACIDYADLDEILTRTIESGSVPLVVMLDGITDVRNFGAIARSAECAGASAIVVPTTCAAPVGADAMRTSAGALNYIPVCRCANIRMAVSIVRNYGLVVLAADGSGTKEIYDAELQLPVAIVFGSEDLGVSSAVLKIVDEIVRIPLQGRIESLNVASAAAVMLFEALRQRSKVQRISTTSACG